MNEQKRIFLLILIMTLVALVVGGISMAMLYRAAFAEERARLTETAQSQARLIEAVARFEAAHQKQWHPGVDVPVDDTLEQIRDAHRNYVGSGETGEFTLAKLEGDMMVFLLNHRHAGEGLPQPIAFNSKLAEPMRRSLSGRSGTVIGLDYRGDTVLAAYEPVSELDWGIVAKIDLAEIQAPFIRAGIMAGFAAIGIIILGAVLFLQITNPLLKQLQESEQRFRGTFEQAAVGIAHATPDGQLTRLNQRFCDILGYNQHELLGRTFQDITHPDDVALNLEYKEQLMAGDIQSYALEKRYLRKDGSPVWVELTVSLVREPSGETRYLLGVIEDISRRKQAEEALRKTTARHAAMIENIGDVIAIIGADGMNKYQSPNIEKWFGWKPEDMLVGIAWDYVHPEDMERIRKEFNKILEKETASILEFRFKCKDGTYTWIELTALNRINDPAIDGVLLSYHDITERKQAEEMESIAAALKEENKNAIQSVMDSIPGFAFIKDRNLKYVTANHTFCDLLKIPYDQIAGKTDYDIFPPDLAAKYIADDTKVMKSNTPFYVEEITVDKNKNDKRFIVATRKIPWLDEKGSVCGIYGLGFDISELKDAQEELVESEKKLREAQEMAHLGFWSWDVTSGEVEWSEEVFNIFGLDPDTFTPQIDSILALSPWPEDHHRNTELIKHAVESHAPGHYEQKFLRPDQSIGHYYSTFQGKYDEHGELVLMVGTVLDTTERKQAEAALQEYSERLEEMVAERTRELREAQEQIVRHEKLVVLGQMAGSVGHELRNPLGVINNALYFLQAVHADGEAQTMEYLDIIAGQVRKSDKIVSDLLNFSRTGLAERAEREEAAVSTLVQRVLAAQPAPEPVDVRVEIAAALPPVFVDKQQIEQVLTNLVSNAYQAMPNGGALTVSAQPDADKVVLAVADTGAGISPENIGKLFEPLFTTKTKGIGLGLAVSKNLVEANGGRIEVSSEEGQGSVFTLFLPTKGGV